MLRFDSNIRHRTSIRRFQQKYLKLFTTLNNLSKSDLANPSDFELVGLLNFDPSDLELVGLLNFDPSDLELVGLPNPSDPSDLPDPYDPSDPPEPSDPSDLPDPSDPLIP